MAQGTFRMASWRGIQVAVKKLGEEVLVDEDKVWVIYEPWRLNFEGFFFLIFAFMASEIVLSFVQESIQWWACIASEDTTSKCSSISWCCDSK